MPCTRDMEKKQRDPTSPAHEGGEQSRPAGCAPAASERGRDPCTDHNQPKHARPLRLLPVAALGVGGTCRAQSSLSSMEPPSVVPQFTIGIARRVVSVGRTSYPEGRAIRLCKLVVFTWIEVTGRPVSPPELTLVVAFPGSKRSPNDLSLCVFSRFCRVNCCVLVGEDAATTAPQQWRVRREDVLTAPLQST